MNKTTLMNNLKGYLLDNSEELLQVVSDINSWNGQLDYLDFISMDFFDDYMEGNSPSWIAERIYYGDFNPNDDYFMFNGYGNLESYDEYKAIEECKGYIDEIVDALFDNIDNIEASDTIMDMFEELDEIEL